MLNYNPAGKDPNPIGNAPGSGTGLPGNGTGLPGSGLPKNGTGLPGSNGTHGLGKNPFGDPDDDIDPKEYLINYNAKYLKSNPIMFRDTIIQQVLSCLIGKFKPNVIITGAAGVGKTKIVEDIARRIAIKDSLIPSQLLDYTIWELPLTNIVAGSGIVGDIEAKTKAILNFASDPNNKAILFIDEIHMLMSENQTYDKIAQIMKPALARGDIKVIGATTLQESQSLLNDPAFSRRFSRLIVDELSQDQTIDILKQISVSLFTHYNNRIAINDKIINETVKIADQYRTIGAHRPDNAITLLDRAMADAYVKRQVLETNAKAANDQATLNILAASPTISLSHGQLKNTALSLITGNNKKSSTDTNQLRNNMQLIKGQDDVIDFLIDTIDRDNLNLYPRVKPLTLLFAGDSGVGKSEVVKILANSITGIAPIILNMTEYNNPASINRIIGSPVGYVGSDSKTELPFDMLESNPYQVILLDEFEKSDKAVQRLFMSAFDEGYIKTAKGKIVDFSKSIIIATTNAGHTNKSDSIGFALDKQNDNIATISDLSAFFDVELLNRFTRVLNFHPITESLFDEIFIDTYHRNAISIKADHSAYQFLPDDLPDDDKIKLHKDNFAKEFGARPIKRAVQKYIEDIILAKKQNSANNGITFISDDNDIETTDDLDDIADEKSNSDESGTEN